MAISQQFKTAEDFWQGMVVPDYQAYMSAKANLRFAFHAASSLFHMTDWIYNKNEPYICSNFHFHNEKSQKKNVTKSGQFAHSLAELDDNYALIRAVANAGKHSILTYWTRQVDQAPTKAENIASHMTVTEMIGGLSTGALSTGPICGGEIIIEKRIKLQGPKELYFDDIAKSTYGFWIDIRKQYNW